MADQEQLKPRRDTAFVCGPAMDARAAPAHRPRSQAWTRPLDARNGRAWTSCGRRHEIACQAMDARSGRPWTVGMDAPHSLRGVHPSRGGQPVSTMAASEYSTDRHGRADRQ